MPSSIYKRLNAGKCLVFLLLDAKDSKGHGFKNSSAFLKINICINNFPPKGFRRHLPRPLNKITEIGIISNVASAAEPDGRREVCLRPRGFNEERRHTSREGHGSGFKINRAMGML